MKHLIFGIVLGAFSFVTLANTTSPYIGQEVRDIKALSQQEVISYLNGKGLGYAKAAELNHFPGPKHVLDLASELNLTEEQVQKTHAIFNVMEKQAIALGKQFVTKEQELDKAFSSGSINTGVLKALLSEIGTLQSNIRFVHLSAHLKQKALLTEHQSHLYDQLRGYGASKNTGHSHSH